MFKMLIFSKLKSFSHQAKESVRGGGAFLWAKKNTATDDGDSHNQHQHLNTAICSLWQAAALQGLYKESGVHSTQGAGDAEPMPGHILH